MPFKDIYQPRSRGTRSSATYDELKLFGSWERDYRHIDMLSVWNEDSVPVFVSFWIKGPNREVPCFQAVVDAKDEPTSFECDLTLAPYQALYCRHYNGSEGDDIWAWALGTVLTELEGEAL